MPSIEVTGVPDFTKDRDQWFHHGPPESGKPSSESTFYFMAIQLYLDAIPLQADLRVRIIDIELLQAAGRSGARFVLPPAFIGKYAPK
jgi:hypothetical protein